ncbi:hypothetical protein WNZ14_23095 [Hoeflea sp. AS60]|uniref:hypothetical protein n=1 Tax=Hoeflea sp. AS60 TaxID=3135780 RepID=UPI00316F1ADB
MSEWSDNQKKSNANWRSQLYGKIETQTSEKERTLTKEEVKRLAKLRDMQDTLRRGKNVPNRGLQAWLTDGEYAELENEWKTQQDFRKELNDKPAEIKTYEANLKKAIFNENRANGARSKGNIATAANFSSRCERQCEEALEMLEELFHRDPSLMAWFDRSVSFEVDEAPNPSPSSMPRVVTSRSLDRQADHANIMSKADVKLAVVERAIQQLRLGR